MRLLRARAGRGPAVSHFNQQIKACGSNPGKAWAAYQAMRQAGVHPDSSTFNALLTACARARSRDDIVNKVWQELQQSGVPPDVYHYNPLITLCVNLSLIHI